MSESKRLRELIAKGRKLFQDKTCMLCHTVRGQEGIGVVGRFLAQHREFAIYAPATLRESLAGLIDEDGCMRTRPDRGGLDGFFAARLIRRV